MRHFGSRTADVVVLHQAPRPFGSLSLSPFNIKLETYLRISGLSYVNDFVHYTSKSNGRTPWITIDGVDVIDSQGLIHINSSIFPIIHKNALFPF